MGKTRRKRTGGADKMEEWKTALDILETRHNTGELSRFIKNSNNRYFIHDYWRDCLDDDLNQIRISLLENSTISPNKKSEIEDLYLELYNVYLNAEGLTMNNIRQTSNPVDIDNSNNENSTGGRRKSRKTRRTRKARKTRRYRRYRR